MIKWMTSNSPHLHVNVTNAGTYYNSSAPSAGMMRYYNNDVQVYDGNSWLQVGSCAEVRLSSDAESVITWAKQKMTEEMRLEDLMEKHPGLKDAYEKFELMKLLVTEEEQHNG